MDTIISRILGEDALEPEHPEDSMEREDSGEDHAAMVGSDDSEIDELANMWLSGNKPDVLRRFMDMDNKTAVKLVFAIGYESASLLADMADREIKAGEGSPEEFEDEEFEDEGEAVPPPGDETIQGIVGDEAEEAPSHEHD